MMSPLHDHQLTDAFTTELTALNARLAPMCGFLSGAERKTGWQRISAGNGSKGPRVFDWCRVPLNPPLPDGVDRWLLVRRRIDDPDDLTTYTVFAPTGTRLQTLARAAGSRWQVEIGFEEAKGEVGLDEYEVRSWHDWYRHITLALMAPAALAAMSTTEQELETVVKMEDHIASGQSGGVQAQARAVVALMVAEVRWLVHRLLLWKPPPREVVLHWSGWRHHHQAVARRCDDVQRGVALP